MAVPGLAGAAAGGDADAAMGAAGALEPTKAAAAAGGGVAGAPLTELLPAVGPRESHQPSSPHRQHTLRSAEGDPVCMHVRSDGLGMVDGVASTVQRRAIWQVADGVHKNSTGQWRSGSMAVWSNVLGMVDGVPSSVQGSAVWQVTHIVAELLVGVRILLEAVLELAAVHGGSWAGRGCCRRGMPMQPWVRAGALEPTKAAAAAGGGVAGAPLTELLPAVAKGVPSTK